MKEDAVCTLQFTWECQHAESNRRRGNSYPSANMSFTLGNTAMHMSKVMMVRQQYLNAIFILSYDSNRKRSMWRRKNEGRLERDPKEAKRFFFPLYSNSYYSWSSLLLPYSAFKIPSATCTWRLFYLMLRSQYFINGSRFLGSQWLPFTPVSAKSTPFYAVSSESHILYIGLISGLRA